MQPHNVTGALHIVALSAFAIAQPVYDLLGRNAEFLVAHHAGPLAIGLLVLALSAGIPIALIALEWVAGLAGARPRAGLHLLFVAVLVALIAAGLLAGAPVHPAAAMASAAAAGVAGAFAYHRWRGVRTFLSVVSPAAIIFPALFLLATPVKRLVLPPDIPAGGLQVAEGSPVVLVIFDELSTFALLDADGRLDRGRYPSFAALGDDAWWFPNATAAASHTTTALPALLTGRLATEGRIPIAADYPQNLFTWLGGTYRLNVAESVTAMCPPAMCPEGVRPGSDSSLTPGTFASDVGVLYLHVIVPERAAASLLPPIASTWTGFAAQAPPRPVDTAGFERTDLDIMGLFETSVQAGRAGNFRQFIGGIHAQTAPALHFMHSPLPHHPYQYLSSGQLYSRGIVAEGLDTTATWVAHDALVVTARRQYLQQIEAVDRLLGELIAHLKAEGLYDRSLVIVTADHGAAFQAGRPHRTPVADSTYMDIAAVPMFVKLPHQRQGQMSARQVSGIDIVPTIAGVIGAPLPWQSDGASMVAEDFPDRQVLPYSDTAGRPLKTFDTIESAREPARRRQLQAVLSNAAVERYEAFVGKRVEELNVSAAPSQFEVVSDSFLAFRQVDPPSPLVPALVSGHIGGAGEPSAFDVAVAVNGVVRAVTRTAAWNGKARYFAALVPVESFRPGANTLEIFALEDARPKRSGLQTADIRALRFGTSMAARLRLSELRLGPEVQGWVDRAEEVAGVVRLLGWAADTGAKTTVKAVVAFAGPVQVGSVEPAAERPDVSAALSLPPGVMTSFRLDIPLERLRAGPIRIMAVGAGQTAGELQVQPDAAALLRKFH